jgi:hypothetical protein
MSMCYQVNKVGGAPTPFREAAFLYLVLKRIPASERNPHAIARDQFCKYFNSN